MRYWVDTEFIEDGLTIDLLSLGIVAEDGRDNYWQSLECDRSRANEWVAAHVLPSLEHSNCGRTGHLSYCVLATNFEKCPWHSRATIASELVQFCDPARYGKPEFWGYYADYDWVAICQLFGRMVDLPQGWPMFAMDLKQLAVSLGNPRLPESDKEHHSLADAQWNRRAYDFLREV